MESDNEERNHNEQAIESIVNNKIEDDWDNDNDDDDHHEENGKKFLLGQFRQPSP
jgi:hypothetical protein